VTPPRFATLAEIPDLTAISAAWPERYPYLLQSTADGPLSRYSLLLRRSEESLVLHADGSLTGPGSGAGFLGRLEDWYRSDSGSVKRLPAWPFSGGWFVYLGYELAAEIEPVLELPAAADGFPVAFATRCRGAVMLRHGTPGEAVLLAEDGPTLAAMQNEVHSLSAAATNASVPVVQVCPDDASAFRDGVARIQDYLLAGDVFQVNLSRAWRGRFRTAVDPLELYARLRAANPAPFAGFARWGGQAILSSSPERLAVVRGRRVQTRPIAGTHPRGRDADSDRALSKRLLAHPKERAEHIMLIDLERNDLGRVCVPGSVEVNELMALETYAHVHHIVSNVRGLLRPGLTPVDVIRAVFPGGTITGCPKVRCMQIIAELEGGGRGYYTGAMGYLDRTGDMDLNILIRSMLLDGDRFSFRTGAGIVADSQPDREVAETEAKARGLLAALNAVRWREIETA